MKKIKILIATGIFPPDIGGPAQYAKNMAEEFTRLGNEVKVLSYGLEKKLPTFVRHFAYFLRVIKVIGSTDLVVALDTFSVGLPAVIAAKIFRKKTIIRIGGDFLWESYVAKSGDMLILKKFYEVSPALSRKERVIFSLTKFVLRNSSALVFSTEWQKAIFEKPYELRSDKIFVIENFYGEKADCFAFSPVPPKNFLWAGRILKLKNLELLKKAFDEAKKINGDIKLEIITNMSHKALLEKIKTCYAVIVPSLSEVSSNLILDALRCDKPFILTRETGLYEKLKDIGVFIDPLNEGDIKEKILFLANEVNYNKYREKIENFNFLHSWRQIVQEFLAIYQRL